MSGVIEGGWEFVIAAYSISAVVLAVYATTIFVRLRREKNRQTEPYVEGGL